MLYSLTPAAAEDIVRAVRLGVPLETAARAHGISQSALYEWLQIAQDNRDTWNNGHPLTPGSKAQILDLSERIARAKAERESRAVEIISDAAETVGKSGVPEWRAAAWLLNNHPAYRERWREHRQLQVEGNTQVNHYHREVRELPNSALKEALPAEFRELLPGDADTPSQVDDNGVK